jgi:hypothetical protein
MVTVNVVYLVGNGKIGYLKLERVEQTQGGKIAWDQYEPKLRETQTPAFRARLLDSASV